ncbi:hypothetical protein BDQ17DRAFT_1258638 [Cyathus striatus]|nr:hypothetical protein BDQ17DRAFT_1258638 [Cyathus striatus]
MVELQTELAFSLAEVRVRTKVQNQTLTSLQISGEYVPILNVIPDAESLHDTQKLPTCFSVSFSTPKYYQFSLPTHKADRSFEGEIIVIQ